MHSGYVCLTHNQSYRLMWSLGIDMGSLLSSFKTSHFQPSVFFFFQPSWSGLRRTTNRSLPGANQVAWQREGSSIWLGLFACYDLNITHQINQEGMHVPPLAWALSDMYNGSSSFNLSTLCTGVSFGGGCRFHLVDPTLAFPSPLAAGCEHVLPSASRKVGTDSGAAGRCSP